jgi:ABC-type methionine transport system permease subunit
LPLKCCGVGGPGCSAAVASAANRNGSSAGHSIFRSMVAVALELRSRPPPRTRLAWCTSMRPVASETDAATNTHSRFSSGFGARAETFRPTLTTVRQSRPSESNSSFQPVSPRAVQRDAIDGLMSIPSVLIAIALLGVARGSIANVVIAISLSEFPRVARLVRGEVLSLRERAYVSAAVACGSSATRIMTRHILPNALDRIIIQATYVGASAIVAEAVLSFLGVGTPQTILSWGNIMAEGRALWQVKPYIVFFPSVFLCVTVLSVNLLGDGLRDFLDPRSAKRT